MTTRIALVTGGTGGIGTAICKKLHDMGMRVVASYSNTEPQKYQRALAWQAQHREEGYSFMVVGADVSNYESSGALISEIQQSVGGVDVLINAAGITRDGVFKRMTLQQWMEVIQTNLNSVFNVTHHVIPGMLERNFGRVISISSINGQKGQFGQTNYSAAKAGIYGFTKALAQEVANKGITVNSISPGYVDTAMVRAVPQEVRDKIIAQIPVGRLGKPEEIAHAVAFLAAEEGGFVTGSNIAINGGQHMY